MASWDLFHADRLELERGQSTEAIRTALARGELRDDDLVRPAGTTIPWARIGDFPELLAQAPESPPGPAAAATPPAAASPPPGTELPDFEEIQPGLEEVIPPARQHFPTELPGSSTSDVAFPIVQDLEPPSLQPPAGHEPPPSSRAWVWADDEDDEDEDDEDDPKIVEDQDDIEILAEDPGDEAGDRPPDSSRHPASSRPAAHGPGSGDPFSRHAEPREPGMHHEDWDPSAADLNLDESEQSESDSRVALPVVPSRDRDRNVMPAAAEAEPEADFSLSRSATQKIEELDLAPMVDVAFQLVLFFMVTATTVLYKTLEIPKPSGEAAAGAVAQGRSRSLDDLKKDFILVEIDSQGAMKLDQQPIEPVRETLVENLRRAREKTGRKAMLLSAEFQTLHRNAVLAYDAAQEIGLSIAIAKPKPPQGPAPTLRGAPAAASPPTNPRT